MRRQVEWALLNFDLKIPSIYYELSKISTIVNFNFYKILMNFQDQQYGCQNVLDGQTCNRLMTPHQMIFLIIYNEQIDFNHTWWNFLESLWATGRILGRIKIWNNYHRYYMRRQVEWALLKFRLKNSFYLLWIIKDLHYS